ncbi:helix-turn-helix domain-containing protein, partial [Paenibacillus sp. 2TAB19]|uniref:helix-turn-helix domain-containing protein n=1 Tax=Paenibacillus sp. 2TAB19 TaxID=3233003 RepID=UPI003F96F33D
IRERVSEQEFIKYKASYMGNFADELLSGGLSDRMLILEGLQQYFGLDASGSMVCLTVEMDGNWIVDAALTKAAEDLVPRLFHSSHLAERGICLRSRGGKLVFLIQAKTNSFLYYTHFSNEVAVLLREWNRETKLLCSCSFSAGLSSPGNATEIGRLHREANLALAKRLYTGYGSIHIYEASTAIQDKTIVGLLNNSTFISQLSQGVLAEAAVTVNEEFDRLKRERSHTPGSISVYACSLLQQLKVTARNIPADVIEQIHEKMTFIEANACLLLIDEFKEQVISVFLETSSRLSKGLSPLMVRSDEFIRRNFTRELTVETLAEYVSKTPNYFSHLFKREFGISFKEYINRLRIAKAKELILGTNDLIYEISERVGFTDYTYFTQVFKKMEGYSPTVLRKQR